MQNNEAPPGRVFMNSSSDQVRAGGATPLTRRPERRWMLVGGGLLIVLTVGLQLGSSSSDESWAIWNALILAMLLYSTGCLWLRGSAARTTRAREFWRTINVGVFAWLVAHLLDWAWYSFVSKSAQFVMSSLSGLLYTALYLFFMAAVLRLVQPESAGQRNGSRRLDNSRRLDFAGLTIFALGLQVYFVGIPSWLDEAGWQAVRRDASFPNIVFDVYLLIVCWLQSRDTPAQRRVLRALAVTAGCWATTDLLDLLSYSQKFDPWYPPSPSLWELLWFAWFLPFLWAICAPLGIGSEDESTSSPRTELLRSWLPLAGFAFFVPSLHLALYWLGWLDLGFRSARDGFTLVYFAILAALILWKQRRQERVVRDLEDSQELAVRRLREERTRAESALRAKSDFLATMSHELRTPMTGILGTASLLAVTPLAELQRDLVETLHSSGEMLRRLLDDILDLSKIEAGKMELSNVAFDPRVELTAVAALFRGAAADKGLRFEVQISSDTPAQVIGDPLRLRQIITNLISNAVKFTDRGRVNIELAALRRPDSDQKLHLRIHVADSGVGIPDDQLPRIFESFEQLDSSSTRRHEGSGLGLAICRRLLDLMGGEIRVQSLPNLGSSFVVDVPVQLPELETHGPVPGDAETSVSPGRGGTPAPPASMPAPEAEPLGWHVLIAEDLDVNQRLIKAMLKLLGCTTETACNGREALERLDGQLFDLILMDVRMPEMNGLEATRHIRERFAGREASRPRILAVTANSMPEDRDRCFEAGMDGFLAKPFRLETLRLAMCQVMARGDA